MRDYGIDGLEVHVDQTSTGTIYFVSSSCTFTENGESKIYNAGETYFIPTGLRHQITLHADYCEVDYVDGSND